MESKRLRGEATALRQPARKSTQQGNESRKEPGKELGSGEGNFRSTHGAAPETAQGAAPGNLKGKDLLPLRAGKLMSTRPPSDPELLKKYKETFPKLAANSLDANGKPRKPPSVIAGSIYMHPAKTHIGPWQLGKTVGVGGTCNVRLVRHARTGDLAVAKIIQKSTAERVRARSLANLTKSMDTPEAKAMYKKALPVALEREIVIMRLLRHPNIVRLYDVWENADEIYLIMENVEGGELFDFLADRGALPEREAVYLFRQLVEALMYCHRMQIFHRDLKPENILLDKNDFTVKLIDFGMAAYQPNGGLLNTPCGSPHYAAPELLLGKRYDGSKADVWSAAVVLFVMLTADPPFNYPKDLPENQKLKYLYSLIICADVKLPPYLSREARHLFQKVFVSDPKDRISIIELWEHPFMHKYDHEFGYEGRGIESWIGPNPTLDNWNQIAGDNVDPEIFRNLRTLWHDVDEEVLAEKLMNKECNQEKYFYLALCNYHDEALEEQRIVLENTPCNRLVVSPSDYHHDARAILGRKRASVTSQISGSQFSVFKQEHITSKHSFFDNGDCETSPETSDSVRGTSKPPPKAHTEAYLSPKSGVSQRRASLRIESLRQRTGKRASVYSHGSPSMKRLSVARSSTHSRKSRLSVSRNSNASLNVVNAPWTPIVAIKPGTRHKRSVSFNHRRRDKPSDDGSDVSSLDSPFRDAPSQSPEIPSSPPGIKGKEPATLRPASIIPQTPRTRRLRDFDVEARKCSYELEKVMEEAFYRSSSSSKSANSSGSNTAGGVFDETPPSSVSNKSSTGARKLDRTVLDRTILDRPLPPTPVDRHVPKQQRLNTREELIQLRNKVATIYDDEISKGNGRAINDILNNLDRLANKTLADGRRSAPFGHAGNDAPPTSTDELNYLQSIPEEERAVEDGCSSSESSLDDVELAVLFGLRSTGSQVPKRYERSTILPVEPSSPPSPHPWAPLKIRKVSRSSPATGEPSRTGPDPFEHNLAATLGVGNGNETANPPPLRKAKSVGKLPWWRRASGRKEKDSKRVVNQPSSGSDWDCLGDRTERQDQRVALNYAQRNAGLNSVFNKSSESSESNSCRSNAREPSRQSSISKAKMEIPAESELSKKRAESCLRYAGNANDSSWSDIVESIAPKGFFKAWFRKKSKAGYRVDRNVSTTSGRAADEFDSQIPVGQLVKRSPSDWNYLQRVLRIKPEVKIIVMCHARPIARSILCSILVNEGRSGIVDLVRDSENRFSFTGRVGKENKWGLRPVTFALELFSILRQRKKSNLTAVRLTQIRGAGHSVRKLVDILILHLDDSHLHGDASETKEIIKLIQRGL